MEGGRDGGRVEAEQTTRLFSFFLFIYIYLTEGFSGTHKHLSVGGTSMLFVPAAARPGAARRRPNKLISAAQTTEFQLLLRCTI